MDASPITLIMTIIALAIVLLMAWFILKFLSRLGSFTRLNNDLVLRSSLAVGTRERLIVVSYRDKDYLLGVTAGQLSLIDAYPAENEIEIDKKDDQEILRR